MAPGPIPRLIPSFWAASQRQAGAPDPSGPGCAPLAPPCLLWGTRSFNRSPSLARHCAETETRKSWCPQYRQDWEPAGELRHQGQWLAVPLQSCVMAVVVQGGAQHQRAAGRGNTGSAEAGGKFQAGLKHSSVTKSCQVLGWAARAASPCGPSQPTMCQGGSACIAGVPVASHSLTPMALLSSQGAGSAGSW